MRKQTISGILTGIIVCLVIAIIVLIVKIGIRGPKKENEELSLSANETIEDVVDVAVEEDVIEIEPELVASPNTSTSVNVRSGPGTEFERIGSAYATGEYVVIEVLGSGWTKIDYDGEEGYISSEFLRFQYRQDLGDGTFSYSEANVDGSAVVEDEAPVVDDSGDVEQTDGASEDRTQEQDDTSTMIR